MTRHAPRIVELFGLPAAAARPGPPRVDCPVDPAALLRPGHIALIQGASGSGKSSLLRQLNNSLQSLRPAPRWIDLDAVLPPDRPVIDCFDHAPLDQALSMLASVGLAEAGALLHRPGQLSAGQLWRLRLALALDRAGREAPSRRQNPCLLVCDEFTSPLDRVSAAVVARHLRRSAGRSAVAFLLASAHHDLLPALQPDLVLRCDFDRIDVVFPPEFRPNRAALSASARSRSPVPARRRR